MAQNKVIMQSSNKRIATNTLFLYVRMLLTIAVNLYAVRVIWQVLGIDDYGIYNVVGGIVLMFQFLNGAMISTSQRFISFELGRGDQESLKRTFSISVTTHILLSIAILVLAETVGLWFLNAKMNIPDDRMYAANWVYQCSVLAFLVGVVSVPYNACIVAHEHMKAYGYFGVLEVVLKLAIVYLLMIISFDKLIVYAVLVLCVAVVMRLIYGVYCHRHFAECCYRFVKDNKLMGDMFSFAGWSFVGNLGFSVRDQGVNILVNLFFSVTMNAAKGIASQVSYVVRGFTQNFQMALNPQITKRYAAGEIESMTQLLRAGCKYSFFLIMLLATPLYFAAGPVLSLWLDEIPPYAIGFLRLTLMVVLIDSMVSPIVTAIQATGRIKKFQIVISVIMFSTFPIAWLWLKIDSSNPYVVMYVLIIASIVGLYARLRLLQEQMTFSMTDFFRRVIFRVIATFAVNVGVTSFVYQVMPLSSLTSLALFVALSIFLSITTIYLIGMTANERHYFYQMIKNKIHIRLL